MAAIRSLAREVPVRPRTGIQPADLRALVRSLPICPENGEPLDSVLADLGGRIWRHSVVPIHPHCAAHLHPPALVPAIATEAAISAVNQSQDSWDQAPAATELELHFTSWLAGQLGFASSASGVMTSGGTASNLLGFTLARSAAASASGIDVLQDGLPPESRSWRIVASDQAHFSVQRAAAQLGLGRAAIVPVPTDAEGRMRVSALRIAINDLTNAGLRPIVVVATAGTTDLGAVDPLASIADVIGDREIWFHVDASVGGAFVLSERLRPLLDGIEQADSVTVDFHKLWWQPFNASALVVRDALRFDLLRTRSSYLDRGDEPDGVVNLVGRSLDTSRRSDVTKVVAGLRTVGRKTLGAMLEHLVDMTRSAAAEIEASPVLRLIAPPSTITCVFEAPGSNAELHRQVQQRLLSRGDAIIGRTSIRGRAALKLTFVNPLTTKEDVARLVRTITAEIAKIDD